MFKAISNCRRRQFSQGVASAFLFTVIILATMSAPKICLGADHHLVSLQFFHPLATSPNYKTDTNVRLGLIFGRSGSIAGFDACGVASITNENFSGVQLTGLYSWIGGSFTGISFNSGVQIHQGSAAGVQFSGIANFHQDFFTGVQFSGYLNYTSKGFRGAQLSGLMNLNDGSGGFLQFSSVTNVNVRVFRGMQLAAIMNFAGSETFGGQVALLNYADRLEGVQIGLLNITEDMSGVQLGVVNISRRTAGVPVGLINLTDDGRVNCLLYTSNLSLYNIGLRTVVNNWSTVFSLGYSDQASDAVNSAFLGWHFGRLFPINPKLGLTADAGYLHIIPRDYDDIRIDDGQHYALQMRLFADYRLSNSFSLIGGAGFSTVFSEYTTHARSTTEGHVFGGISLF